MSSKSTEFAGHAFDLHSSGALFWPGQQCLVVGDLHLEKASSYHASGQFLPPYDTAQTIERLAAVVDEFSPARLLLLGDVFHDGRAWQRMSQDNKARFEAILARVDSLWIEGNTTRALCRRGMRRRLRSRSRASPFGTSWMKTTPP